MRLPRLLAALPVIAALLAPLRPARADEGATVVVELTGFRNDTGRVMVLLYGSEDGFMRDQKKALARALSPIRGGTARVELRGVPPGLRAISCFHDENDNGDLDTNWLGIPREGVGASNNAKGRLGPPKWKDARFEVTAPVTEHHIKISYL